MQEVVEVTFVYMRENLSPKVTEAVKSCGGDGERVLEKKVIRFFDKTGELTRVALRFDRLARANRNIAFTWERATGLRKLWLFWRFQKKRKRILALKKKAIELVANGLRGINEELREVAMEDTPNCFRFVRKTEAQTLAEQIIRCSNIWIVIFEPCDLVSTKGNMVALAYVM